MQDFSRYSARVVNRPQTMQRPQGRSARIRQQVHWAVIDLLRDRSADELSIPLVADRSGVHQATIYRRWGSIPVLLSDVAAAGPARTSPLPDTGTLRGDLDVYATGVADALAGPLGVLMLRAAVSNIPPDPDRGPSAILAERTQQLQEMLDRAEARGELSPSVDEVLELVVAPLYFHALLSQPASAEHARRLVDRLLAAPGYPPHGQGCPQRPGS
jgi:AcrR family transcriptional regulator